MRYELADMAEEDLERIRQQHAPDSGRHLARLLASIQVAIEGSLRHGLSAKREYASECFGVIPMCCSTRLTKDATS
jgi:hypothetical protein